MDWDFPIYIYIEACKRSLSHASFNETCNESSSLPLPGHYTRPSRKITSHTVLAIYERFHTVLPERCPPQSFNRPLWAGFHLTSFSLEFSGHLFTIFHPQVPYRSHPISSRSPLHLLRYLLPSSYQPPTLDFEPDKLQTSHPIYPGFLTSTSPILAPDLPKVQIWEIYRTNSAQFGLVSSSSQPLTYSSLMVNLLYRQSMLHHPMWYNPLLRPCCGPDMPNHYVIADLAFLVKWLNSIIFHWMIWDLQNII